MLAFLYFVQMLINLPKMLVVSWNNMILLPKNPLYSFKISTVTHPELWMTSSEQNLNISICHVESRISKWMVDGEEVDGNGCSRVFGIKKARRITVVKEEVELASEVIEPRKMFWLASIGDSFSSGQGNPDLEGERKWLDEPCYRSTKAFPCLISQHLPNSALSFLSCSGSTVDNGILSKNGQIESLERLISGYGTPPDTVILTIGGNDIGFSDVISMVQRDSYIDDKFDMRFFFVSHQIDRVAWKLKELKIPKIILLTYYDITKNEKGEVDASCGAFGQVSQANLQLAERKVLQRLNALLRRKAKEHGWITVDTKRIFERRGMCSRRSLIRSKEESLRMQGDEYGSFHPNEEAHRLIAEEVLELL